jgi:hypothetical protein
MGAAQMNSTTAREKTPTELLDEIKKFQAIGSRDDRGGWTLPYFVITGLETAVTLLHPFRKGPGHVAAWAFAGGVARLFVLKDIEDICAVRNGMLARGLDTSRLDDWRYCVSSHGRRTQRLSLRNLDSMALSRCSEITRGLGYAYPSGKSVIPTVAMMVMLNDLHLPGEVGAAIASELEAWMSALTLRAIDVATQDTNKRRTWADLSQAQR